MRGSTYCKRTARPAFSLLALLLGVGALFGVGSEAHAQGLLWKLPDDGTWIRFEGKYLQTEFRPDSTEGDLNIEWIRNVTVKSVGQETAEYNGSEQPCRWIEFHLITGKASESGIDAGPGGDRIYKLLVPESRIAGTTDDADGIFVGFVPVVKGYRRIGNEPPEEMAIENGVFKAYPLISLLNNYRTFDEEPNSQEDVRIDTRSGTSVTASRYKGQERLESHIGRSVQEAQLWRSDDAPFGLAKWTAKIVREVKEPIEPRSAFKRATEINVEMEAVAVGQDAVSELVVPQG